jgi:hypothetical protein
MSDTQISPSTKRQNPWKRVVLLSAGVLLLYPAVAYFLVPFFWIDYAHHHPALEDTPGLTYTADGIPGDPLNVALVGTKAEVIRLMLAAQWHPADLTELFGNCRCYDA